MRGDLCPYDHGSDPVVLEDVSLSQVLPYEGGPAQPGAGPPGSGVPNDIGGLQSTIAVAPSGPNVNGWSPTTTIHGSNGRPHASIPPHKISSSSCASSYGYVEQSFTDVWLLLSQGKQKHLQC